MTSTAIEQVSKGSTLAVSGNQNFWSPEQLAALKQIGVSNAPNADLAVSLNYAQKTGLDPFARQIYMIGRREKQGNDWGTKWTIQASIDGLRIVAERSGDYAGQVGPEYCGTDGVWRDVWVGQAPPVAARVGVLRKGFAAPLYAVAYFDEYAQMRDGKPTSMWASKPKLMLAKCAEALALRKAFPNDLSGIYTADEMGSAETRQAPVVQDTWTKPAPQAQPEPDVDLHTGEIIEEPEIQEATIVEPSPVVDTPAPVVHGGITQAQAKAVFAILRTCEGLEDEPRIKVLAAITGRHITQIDELTKQEASQVIETLKPFTTEPNPPHAFQGWLAWS
jgi:phage recombination protein Bet